MPSHEDMSSVPFTSETATFVTFGVEQIPFARRWRWVVKGYAHARISEKTRLSIPNALPVTFQTQDAALNVAYVYQLLLAGLTRGEIQAMLEDRVHQVGQIEKRV